MEIICYLGLANVYGGVQLVKHENKYYLALEDYDGDNFIEISKFLAGEIIREFQETKTMKSGSIEDGKWYE